MRAYALTLLSFSSEGENLLNPSPFKGEVGRGMGMGMGLYLLNCQPNLLLYRFYLLQNLVVPKSEHAKTGRLQYLRTILIIPCLLSVLSPIYLNDQFVF